MKKLTYILIILVATTLISCSFYKETSEDNITVTDSDLLKLTNIQKDISNNYKTIADSIGYFSDRFYFETERFNKEMKVLKETNNSDLKELYNSGVIKSFRVINSGCYAYLLEAPEVNNLIYEYWDEIWLVYSSTEDSKCGEVNSPQETTIWTKQLNENWKLIKNKRRRYIGG